ncbi:uncharacterized protein LRP34_006569 [Phaethornis superciliosus]
MWGLLGEDIPGGSIHWGEQGSVVLLESEKTDGLLAGGCRCRAEAAALFAWVVRCKRCQERIKSGLLGVHPKLVSIWQSQLRSLALEGRPAAGAADEGESLGAEDDGEEKTRTSGDLPVEPEEEGRGMAQDTRRPASELPGLGSTLGEVLISPADPSTGAREETDAAIKH